MRKGNIKKIQMQITKRSPKRSPHGSFLSEMCVFFFVLLFIPFASLIPIVSAIPQHAFVVDLQYEREQLHEKEKLFVTGIHVRPLLANEKILNNPGGYIAELVDDRGNALNVGFFNIPLEMWYDSVGSSGEVTGGGQASANTANKTIFLPYDSQAAALNLYNEHAELLSTYSLSAYNIPKLSESAALLTEERTLPLPSQASPQTETVLAPALEPQTPTTPSAQTAGKKQKQAKEAYQEAYLLLGIAAVLLIMLLSLWRYHRHNP